MPDDNEQKAGDNSTDLNISAIINALFVETSLAEAQESDAQPAFDPNATMNYQEAGVPYPELPFANEETSASDHQKAQDEWVFSEDQFFNSKLDQILAQRRNEVALEKALEDTQTNKYRRSAEKREPTADQLNDSLSDPFAEQSSDPFVESLGELFEDSLSEPQITPQKTLISRREKPPVAPRSPYVAPRNRSTATDTVARPLNKTFSRSIQATRPISSADTIDGSVSGFRPVNTKKASYKIRGGGGKGVFNSRSPVFFLSAAVLVIVCVGIFVYGFNTITGSLTSRTSGISFNLNTDQTREAIDSRIPVLVHYIDVNLEDTFAIVAESGQSVYNNTQYQPDSPDAGASASEMLSMPQETNDELLARYYEDSFNAFTSEELTQYFNGSYVLDMARGELGNWNKLRYVNFNAASIEDEMSHLASIQDLTGDTVTVSSQGLDSRGNRVIQGQKVIDGERILYFKIAACPFNDVYSRESLSGASVYVSCTLATYDFFTGSDTIT